MHDITSLDCSRIAQDLQIRKVQVEAVVGLLDDSNTVPFITRYRKERTGGLNEDVIRRVQQRVGQLRHLAERKQTILKNIAHQGSLTDDLREAILAAAKKNKCDAIVMASHGRRGVSALLLGSETQKVLTHSKLPVIVVR